MLTSLSSRKLAAVISAILGIVGLVIGLAVIQPDILLDDTGSRIIALVVLAISGLGGFVIYRQAKIDEGEGGVDA